MDKDRIASENSMNTDSANRGADKEGSKAKKRRKRPASMIVKVIGIILCVVFGLTLLFNLTIIIKGLIHPETPPSVFGYTPMIVKSGSMSSNTQHTIYQNEIVDMTPEQIAAIKVGDTVYTMAEDYRIENKVVSVGTDAENPVYIVERPAPDHIETGDLIFSKKIDAKELKVGDIISYMEGQSAVTHRIVRINEVDEKTGKRSFVTKGDFNNGVDTGDPIQEDALIGIFKARVPALGDFIYFLQKPVGMAIFIGVPVLAFVVFDIIRRNRSSSKAASKTEALEAELERLRALAKQQEEKEKAESAGKGE
ncbi:MAG: signal peptidase I [Clostridia bacterium]|nr:signal peptidase I [Clostridia bacterium]